MPKFTKTESELETHFDKWLFVLRNLEDLTKRPEKLQEKVFAKLFDQAEIANYSDDEYAEYEDSLKYYRDLKSSIDTAFDEGKLEGKSEGMLEGEIKGKVEGKTETAIKMKKKGYAIADIVEITGLSFEKVEHL